MYTGQRVQTGFAVQVREYRLYTCTGQRVQTVHLHRSESTDCAHVQVTEYRLFTYTGQRVKPVHMYTGQRVQIGHAVQVREYRLDTQYGSESTDCTLVHVREYRLYACTGQRVQTVHMYRSQSTDCTHAQVRE